MPVIGRDPHCTVLIESRISFRRFWSLTGSLTGKVREPAPLNLGIYSERTRSAPPVGA